MTSHQDYYATEIGSFDSGRSGVPDIHAIAYERSPLHENEIAFRDIAAISYRLPRREKNDGDDKYEHGNGILGFSPRCFWYPCRATALRTTTTMTKDGISRVREQRPREKRKSRDNQTPFCVKGGGDLVGAHYGGRGQTAVKGRVMGLRLTPIHSEAPVVEHISLFPVFRTSSQHL